MLTLLKNNTLAFVMMNWKLVATQSCQNTSLSWSAHSMPWLIKHDPIKTSEAIVPLPPLSPTSNTT